MQKELFNIQSCHFLAFSYLKLNNLESALNTYKDILRFEPKDLIANINYETTYYVLYKKHDDAIKYHSNLSLPNDLTAKEEKKMALLYLKMGKFKEALDIARSLLKRDQKEEYFILITHIYTLLKKYDMADLIFLLKNKLDEKEIYLEMAHSAFLNEDYEKGILRLKDILKADSTNFYAIVNLGVMNFYFGNYENSLAYFEKLDKKLLNIRELYYMNVAYRVKKNYNNAEMCLE